eukprot:7441581-Pyramimonas_sp.AAC.2
MPKVDHCIHALRDALCFTLGIQDWGPMASSSDHPDVLTVTPCAVLLGESDTRPGDKGDFAGTHKAPYSDEDCS